MRSRRTGGGAAVGERQEEAFQLSFNGWLRVNFQGARVTSDGGLLLVRELDERLVLGKLNQYRLKPLQRDCRPGYAGVGVGKSKWKFRLKRIPLLTLEEAAGVS